MDRLLLKICKRESFAQDLFPAKMILELCDSVTAETDKVVKLNLTKVTISKNALVVEKIDPGNSDDLL